MADILRLLNALDTGLITLKDFQQAKAALALPAFFVPPEPPAEVPREAEPTPELPALKRRRTETEEEPLILLQRDRDRPCKFWAKGRCWWASEQCPYQHVWCWFGQKCNREDCRFRHY